MPHALLVHIAERHRRAGVFSLASLRRGLLCADKAPVLSHWAIINPMQARPCYTWCLLTARRRLGRWSFG